MIGKNRVLGDGKTWRGTVAGTIGGFCAAIILNQIVPVVRDFSFSVEPFTIQVIFGLAFGSMLGDIFASFLKRRTGRSRGSPLIPLDQLDFVVGSLTVSFILDSNWITGNLNLEYLVVILILTAVIHILANVVGYKIGVKEEPY